MGSVSWGVQKGPLWLPSVYVGVTHPAVCEPVLGHKYLGGGLARFQEEIWILCTCFPSHSTKSYIQSCDQCQLRMRNEQVLTMEKVIHQSSKLKSNKIKLNAEERVGKGNWGGEACMDTNWYFHYLLCLECIFEGMATHNLQSLPEWAWDLSHQTEATAMSDRKLKWLSRFPQNQKREKRHF